MLNLPNQILSPVFRQKNNLFNKEEIFNNMKKCLVILLMMLVPASGWAQGPSNEELLQMIKKLEAKFDAAMEQTQKALAEADKAKAEAAAAKAELARLKATPASAADAETTVGESLVRVPATRPGFAISMESVYLRPSRSGLDYGIVDPDTDTDVEGRFENVEPDYGLGVRSDLRYNTDSGRDIGITFSWLKTEDETSEAVSAGGALWGTWIHANATIDDNNVDTAEASYEFEQTVLDLSAGQKLEIGKNLDMRLEAGLRFAKIEQELDIGYIESPAAILDRVDLINHKNDFSGLGPRLGLDLGWKMGGGFNLFGSFGGSLLLGDFDISYTEIDGTVYYDGTPDTLDTRINTKDSYKNRLVPVVEARAGIDYAHRLKSGRIIGAKAGYEWQNWFNMVTSQGFMDDVDAQLMETDTTDLGLDGFFFEGYIHF
jgi:Legionella pneumophila major outer membrane protein precursor